MSRKLLIVLTLLLGTLLGAVFASAQDEPVTFVSTQFNVVEEAEKFRGILGDQANFVTSDEGPMIDLLRAEGQSGTGTNDVVGSLHGTFPTLAADDLLFDLTDLLAEIEAEVDIADAFVTLGQLGTTDYQYYIPWMQATYVMAASNEALEYLPEGADLNALTWEQVGVWCQALAEGEGEAKCGFPAGANGLLHRLLEGYLWPSFTGGMVTKFNSAEAAGMLEWVRDGLWPYVNPESINYEFMNEPLLSGEVWLTLDHTARLKPAFDENPEGFVAFPAPAGPEGRGFMPVVAGFGIPFTSDDPDGAEALITYMLSPEVQSQVLTELGFFPVVEGVSVEDLPPGIQKTADAVAAQSSAPDALPALLPVGLGARGGEINQVFRNAFTRVIMGGEDAQTVLDEEAATLQTLLDETGAACWAPDAPSEGACQIEGMADSA